MKKLIYCFTALLFIQWPLDVQAKEPAAPVVSVVPVATQHLSPSVKVTGQVQSRLKSDISAGVSGKLTWVVEPGNQVRQGDVLARLETQPWQNKVRQLELKIQRKTITINKLKGDLERMQELHHQSAISQRDLDNQSADLALAETDLELLRVELDDAKDKLSKTQVVAPFSGVVAKRYRQEGQDVTAAHAIVYLINTQKLEVRVNGPLAYADFPRAQGAMTVHFNKGETRFPLRSIVPVSDERSQTFSAYLEIPEADAGQFYVGQLVSVDLPSASPELNAVVPRDSLIVGKERTQVYVLDQDGKAKAVDVEVIAGQGDKVSVKGNLSEGQRVVVRGGETLSDGQLVRVLTAEEFPLSTIAS
ncbi:Multidrug resistance protein MdtA [Saliniradius amylolyticus]|uniref:Multidrug resistance protein MdtA n=1 Tax=Saliniradius amylolyticus TaxID=2183582 RepID=A0A2S2E1P7_9ALTE|nr:efflux RND transporter periplasmic adaptor subunit [Saliniradius amylolyticus]AWL11571.1 Multidrug resistance protein MdtA [Saliniradius amylolyticus]